MENTKTLPQSEKARVGNDSHTSTPQVSNSSIVEKKKNTLPQSPKQESTLDSMQVGSLSLKNLKGKKLPTGEDARATMRLVAASTLNWLLVRILYLELGVVMKADGLDYYEVRLPTRLWEHDGKVFRLK